MDYRRFVDIQREIWDSSAIKSDNLYQQVHFKEKADYKSIAEEIVYFLDMFHRITKESKLLEVGCGNCLLLEQLKEKIHNIYGVELSSELAKKCERLKGINVVIDEALNIDKYFPENFFDFIVCNSVFQYFPDELYAYNVVYKMIKLTKKRGVIFIGDIYNKRLKNIYENKYLKKKFIEKIKDTLKKIASKFGYKYFIFKYLYLEPEFFIKNFSKNGFIIPKLIVSNKPLLFKKFRYDILIWVK